MKFKGKIDEATAYVKKEWEVTKDVTKDAHVMAKQGREVARQFKDEFILGDSRKAAKVDVETAKTDVKFVEFAEKTGQDLDWTEKEEEAREAYVVFERAKKVSKNLTELFTEKLKGIQGDNPELEGKINDYLAELAKTEPHKLRTLERQIDAVAKGEKQNADKQKEIDEHRKGQTVETLTKEIEQIKKAASFKRKLIQWFKLDKRIGVGKDTMKAYDEVYEKYRYQDRKGMKAKVLEGKEAELETLTSLEDQKTKIKSKFSQERAEIFLDSETAKFIHGFIEASIQDRITELYANGGLSDLKKLKTLYKKAGEQFSNEGRIEYTGRAKKILGEHPLRNVDFLKLKPEDFEKKDSELTEMIAAKVAEDFADRISKSPPGELQTEIDRYFQRKEFAGQTKEETAKRFSEALITILSSVPLSLEKTRQVALVLDMLEKIQN